jgi:hypothetical protein
MTIYTEIEKTKARLIKRTKTKGLVENFGQKEVRKLRDKWGYDAIDNKDYQQALYDFEMWTMNYEG